MPPRPKRAGHHDDDPSAVDGRSQIGRRRFDRRKSTRLAFDIYAATRADVRQPRTVYILQPQLEPSDAQFGDEIAAAIPAPMIATVSALSPCATILSQSTIAITSTSIMKSGWASRRTSTVVLVGVAGPK